MAASERALTARLHRIEGQIRGIEQMLQHDRPCEEVLVQLLAARTALDRVTSQVVTSRVGDCLASQPAKDARDSIQRIVELLLRST